MELETIPCKDCVGADCILCHGIGMLDFSDLLLFAADAINKRGLLLAAESENRRLKFQLESVANYQRAGLLDMAAFVAREVE